MSARLAGYLAAVTIALLASGLSASGPTHGAVPHHTGAMEIPIEGAPFKGRAEAPVVVVEFSDFQCGFCGRHARRTLPLIEARYLETGSVKYVFKHLPRPSARRLHQAAACAAGRGVFWQVHTALFTRTGRADDPLGTVARTLAMPLDEVLRCATSPQHVARVEQDHQSGREAGITGTPAFFIGRPVGDSRVAVQQVITGAKPFAVFQQVLDGLLSQGHTR